MRWRVELDGDRATVNIKPGNIAVLREDSDAGPEIEREPEVVDLESSEEENDAPDEEEPPFVPHTSGLPDLIVVLGLHFK